VAERAVVYQHEPGEGPGVLSSALEEAGFTLEVRFREARPADAEAALVVALGGPMGAYEASQHPFLAAELSVLRARVMWRKPTLGVCLGAQMLAAAAGARVYPGPAGFELGVASIVPTPAAAADPVFAGLPPSLNVVQWHADTYDAVPGAVRLASSARYVEQAFRIGPSYGLQFHVELDAANFERWVRGGPADLARAGRSAEEVLDRDLPLLVSAEPALRALSRRLALALR
jgi:GMP synthase (glutamine-hydrolysing)